MRGVSVALEERSYLISLGAGVLCDRLWWQANAPEAVVAVITDRRVARHYLEPLVSSLEALGKRVVPIVIEGGEARKDWSSLDALFEALLRARCDRHVLVVALGGGVIGDLAGFAAASYLRGVAFIQVPTTLLAQVDSSIGGKTGINHPLGKNMIGAFYQPRAVLIDVATLSSLSERQFAAGMAEVIKHGAVASEPYLATLEDRLDALLAREPATLIDLIAQSCEIKAAVVAADERESGRRAILNFGHTFGHAIEAGLGFGVWLHGEAVAAGMVQAARLSVDQGTLGAREAARLSELIGRCGLPRVAPDLGEARWLELMALDKKAAGGAPRFVLLNGIGHAYVGAVDEAIVRGVLTASATLALETARALAPLEGEA